MRGPGRRRLQLTQAADVTPPHTATQAAGRTAPPEPPAPLLGQGGLPGRGWGSALSAGVPVSAAASLSAWDLSQVTESELGRRQGRRQPPRDPQEASEGGARAALEASLPGPASRGRTAQTPARGGCIARSEQRVPARARRPLPSSFPLTL